MIELRNIEVYPRLSEETTAFSADIYFEGRKVGTAENSGKGGCNDTHWEDRGVRDRFIKWCSEQPAEKHTLGGDEFTIAIDEDFYITKLIEKHMADADKRKVLKKLQRDFNTGIPFKLESHAPNAYGILKVTHTRGDTKLTEMKLNQYAQSKGTKLVGYFDPAKPEEFAKLVAPDLFT